MDVVYTNKELPMSMPSRPPRFILAAVLCALPLGSLTVAAASPGDTIVEPALGETIALVAPRMSGLSGEAPRVDAVPWSAAPGPNCANIMAQAGSAAVGLFAQTQQLIKVCNQNGWNSGPCIAQGLVVASATIWFWWTTTQYYCQCTQNPHPGYCGLVGALPAPPNPGAGGGGLPPAGPPPPGPPAAKLN